MTPSEISAMLADLRSLHIATEHDRELGDQLGRLLAVDAEGRQMPVPVRFASRDPRHRVHGSVRRRQDDHD